MTPSVWFVTGVSNGVGRILSIRALRAGHKVIGTVRSKATAEDAVQEIEALNGKIVEMDLTESQHSIIAKVQAAESIFGKIDILVNNAGYSTRGALENFTEKEVLHQFQTNVYGPLYTIQAVLPGMRARRSGTIVNISSVGGQVAVASSGLYCSSKFALEGIGEALAREVAEFGIWVLIVEPGAFRTNFLNAVVPHENGVTEAYRGTAVEAGMDLVSSMSGKQPGDPEKAVEKMWEVITGEGESGHLKAKILRLPLGPDTLKRVGAKLEDVKKDLDLARHLASMTDFD